MHFSQIIILIFALSLSFTVTAKPSWKDASTATEKPGGKGKNRDNTTSEPVVDTTSDPGGDTASEPIDDTTSEPITDTASDPGGDTISEPIVDTTSDPGADTESEPLVNTESEPLVNTESEPLVNTESEPLVNTESEPLVLVNTESEPLVNTESEPLVNTESEPLVNTESEPVSSTTPTSVTGTATLSWDIPVSRENGDLLTLSELDGYTVLVRDTANNTEYFIEIDDPNITEWTFEELTAGLWEFSIATVDVQGVYSKYSVVVSKIIY